MPDSSRSERVCRCCNMPLWVAGHRDDCQVAPLEEAAERIASWVGPGYPDLDDLDERDAFMEDVRKVAWAWYELVAKDGSPDTGKPVAAPNKPVANDGRTRLSTEDHHG